MSACPNATSERGDGFCGGTQYVPMQTTNRQLSGRPVPCPSCWQAAGYPRLTARQVKALAWWRLALERLVEVPDAPQLFEMQDQDAVELFAWADRRLPDEDVDARMKTAWQAWMSREVPV